MQACMHGCPLPQAFPSLPPVFDYLQYAQGLGMMWAHYRHKMLLVTYPSVHTTVVYPVGTQCHSNIVSKTPPVAAKWLQKTAGTPSRLQQHAVEYCELRTQTKTRSIFCTVCPVLKTFTDRNGNWVVVTSVWVRWLKCSKCRQMHGNKILGTPWNWGPWVPNFKIILWTPLWN